MDKNTITGLLLIFLLLLIWGRVTAPSAEQMAEEERQRDSILLVQQQMDSLANIGKPVEQSNPATAAMNQTLAIENDSLRNIALAGNFGPFAASATGTEADHVLENDVFKITFTNKGGRIKEVLLKKYDKLVLNKETKEETKEDLKLLEDLKNRFDYFLPVANLPTGSVRTGDLYFQATPQGNSITFRANAGPGQYFEQKYTIKDSSYNVAYDVQLVGLDNVLSRDQNAIKLNWINYLDKIERNAAYEKNYSTVYYKPVDDGYENCSCTGDDQEDTEGQAVKWVSHSHQFFNTTLIGEEAFSSAVVSTKMSDEKSADIKMLQSELILPLKHEGQETFAMNWYLGPNKYENLKAYDLDLEDVIPFGSSIFGTVNRWIIRPLFNFLSSFIGSAGLVIFLLTLLVKMVLYPLTYKMLYSQSKMAALKPRIEKLNEKLSDDPQAKQMETMKMYREYGVNPLGGCMPMFLQMPIWFALYRFFPASIEFRQASFLWASDLSSFDVFAYLPMELPFYGEHVSMFTLLWAGTTLIYTYYNTRHMDMSANPAMKYMQYLMPVMFLFFFNNFASGLTCYLLFSNVINIGQTIATKNFIINKDKLERELSDYKKKPKKKNSFQQKLEDAMKEQRKVQTDREQTKKKGKKK